ncbi:MAG: hypothetical protein ACOYK6_03255 [Chthoniobacterales bacterium]
MLTRIFHNDHLRKPGSLMGAALDSRFDLGNTRARESLEQTAVGSPKGEPSRCKRVNMHTYSSASKYSPALPHQVSQLPRYDQHEIFGLIYQRFAILFFLLAGVLLFLSGCETIVSQNSSDRTAITAALAKEKPGSYYVGRRFYKVDYHMWGWVKKPGELWKKSQLVMLNEQQALAPDRKSNHIGADNNYEYHLEGYYSGNKVYEPASDAFYPEFVLKKSHLISTTPPLIFPDSRWIDPKIRLLEPPSF